MTMAQITSLDAQMELVFPHKEINSDWQLTRFEDYSHDYRRFVDGISIRKTRLYAILGIS